MEEFDVLTLIETLARSRNVERKVVVEALEAAMTSASKRSHLDIPEMEVHIIEEDDSFIIVSRRTVVEEVENPGLEIKIEEARDLYDEVELGDELDLEISPSIFGRNAAQIAKQVVIQRLQEAERDIILEEFKGRVGEILSGTVKREHRGNIIVDLGRTEGILPYRERIPGEEYRLGDRVRAYLLKVEETSKGPQLVLSRAHPNFLSRLFEIEVPEIYEEIVIIHNVARDPGIRSKIMVSSRDKNVDPVGTCVGMRGYRVQAVVRELSGEKVDIVRFSENIDELARNSLAPAQITTIEIDNDNNELTVIVPENQLSLAIGKHGQNVRLAAKLLGWKLEVMSETERDERRIKEEEEEDGAIAFFSSVGGIGEDLAITLYEEGFLGAEDILAVEVEELLEIEGVGPKLAASLVEQSNEYMDRLAEEQAKAAEKAAEEAAAAEAEKADNEETAENEGVSEDEEVITGEVAPDTETDASEEPEAATAGGDKSEETVEDTVEDTDASEGEDTPTQDEEE